MKIVTIIPTLRGGGAERVVSGLTKEWAKSHQVTVAFFDASRTSYDCAGRIVDLGLQLPISGNRLMGIMKKTYSIGVVSARLITLLRQEQPDRIFSFMEKANFVAIAAASWAGCLDRLYVSVRGNPTTFPFLFLALISLLYRLPAGIVVGSDGMKQCLELRHVSATKISVIPNPISRTDKQAIGQKSVAPFPNRFILGVGRLDRHKGFDRLLGDVLRLFDKPQRPLPPPSGVGRTCTAGRP